MENHVDKRRSALRYEFPPDVKAENTTDAMGMWFAAAVFCAFLAAGVIVYRAGNSDFQTASNDVGPAVALATPIDAPTILPSH